MKPEFMKRLSELTELTTFHKRAYLSHPSRWYWRLTTNFLVENVKKEARILDLGCGYGTLGIELKKLGFTNYWGVDSSPEKVKVAKQLYGEFGFDPERINVGNLRKLHGKWDAIICLEVLYDVERRHVEYLLENVKSNLNKGGFLIFTEFVKEGKTKPNRTYLAIDEVKKLLERGRLTPVKTVERHAFNLNVWYAAVKKNKPKRRPLIVSVDGDWFPFYAYDFYNKVIREYPFKFTASIVWEHLEDSSRHGIAADTLSDPKVEVASHSYTHPKDWTEADLDKEIRQSVENLNAFLKAKNIDKRVKGFLWTGNCNPTAEAIAMTDRMGLYNFNGKCKEKKPFLNIGGRIQYLQRGFHDTWWRNKIKKGNYDREAIEYFESHPERPVHIYLHYHAVNQDHWPSVKKILDWASFKVEEGELESIWVSEYIKTVKKEHEI